MRKIAVVLLLCLAVLAGCGAPVQSEKEKITSLSQLSSKKIAVLEDSPAESIVSEKFPDATMKKEKTLLDAVVSLNKDKADAIVFVDTVLNYAVEENGAFSILPEPVQQFHYVIAASQDNSVLIEQVNGAINQLKSEGTIDEMKSRWFQKGDSENLVMPQIPEPESEETLTVGVEAVMIPFSYKNAAGQVIGFDVELAKRIGLLTGKKIEIKTMDFQLMKPSLQEKTVDLAIVGINDVDSMVDTAVISEPYMSGNYAVLVKN